MMMLLKAIPVVLGLAAGGYLYHNYVVTEKDEIIAQLKLNYERASQNASQLETALDISQQSLATIEAALREQQESISDLNQKNNALVQERDEYLSIFRRHDLTNLARAKPGLVEPRINSGTAKVFRSIEEDSREVKDAGS